MLLRRKGSPHRADLVTQTRPRETIEIGAPFGLPDALERGNYIRHLDLNSTY
jgi:hypothetical protein